MSGQRKAMSKRLRFEVFKRDGFTCQYCGAQAPDAVLHVDHINPVANGGDNDLLNLTTACADCNSGKGAKKLSDKTLVQKQRKQLQELAERHDQLKMLMDWREELKALQQTEFEIFDNAFADHTNFQLNETGKEKLTKWLKRFSMKELLEALDLSAAQYEEPEKVFQMTVRIAANRGKGDQQPWMKDLYYIRGIIRNRHYCNEYKAIDLLKQAFFAGIHLEDLKQLALAVRNWSEWRTTMEEWIEEAGDEQN